MAKCEVHWVRIPTRVTVPTAQLSGLEVRRARRFVREGDRRRFVVGALFLRVVVSSVLAVPPRTLYVDRRCAQCSNQHGRPVVPGTGLFVSVSHAEDVVGLAVTRAGHVGIDVEPAEVSDYSSLTGAVLGPQEQAQSARDLTRYWTRKEALVKATGDGIGIGLPRVHVSLPKSPALMYSYPGRPDLVAALADLKCRNDYAASLALITDSELFVTEQWHHYDSVIGASL